MLASGASTLTATADIHVIELYSTSFVPAEVVARAGDTIRWEYVTGYPHTATSGVDCTPDGLFASGSLNSPGDFFEWVVPDGAASQVPFFCEPHCNNGMEGVINVVGNMEIGLVDISDLYEVVFFHDEETGYSSISLAGKGEGTYAIGVEISGNDVPVDINAWAGVNSLYNIDQDQSTSLSGNQTIQLSDGNRYMFSGSNPGFTLSWPDEPSSDEGVASLGCGDCSVHMAGDGFSIRTVSGTVSFNGPAELPMTRIGEGVTSSVLTLPPNGEEGTVSIPVTGGAVILSEVGGPAWLLVNTSSGGDGNDCPEDIDNSGRVDVGDLLAVIAAWGTVCP